MSSGQYVYGRGGHSAFHTSEYVFHQLIPYIGNKRKLLELIQRALARTDAAPGATFLDLFAGSGVVSRLAKKSGYRVISNDWEPYAEQINRCYVECNTAPAFKPFGGYENAIAELNAACSREGWVTRHLCPADDDHYDVSKERMFYTRANGMILDGMRSCLECWQQEGLVSPIETSCLLAPMLYQACYTSNTSGVFKGFHNGWGGQTKTALYRILSQFRLKPTVFCDNRQENVVHRMDATRLAAKMKQEGEVVDVAYLDPPYNQHPYGSNYHVLNTVTLWDRPLLTEQISGRNKSAIREDWRTERRSPYNHRAEAAKAYDDLLRSLGARYVLTSYSTDGLIPLASLIASNIERGHVDIVMQQYKRYRVSSQRFSLKPINVEFVLITDTTRLHRGPGVEQIRDQILQAERLPCAPPEPALRDSDT